MSSAGSSTVFPQYRQRSLRAMLSLVLASCGQETEPPAPPTITATVALTPHNRIAADVSATVTLADSVGVTYGPAGDDLLNRTASVPAMPGTQQLPLLGLSQGTSYDVEVIAWGPGGQATSGRLRLTTGGLPGDLRTFSAGGVDPGSGYVAFALGRYGVIIDRTGRVVWYRELPGGPTLNFQVAANGHYVTHPIMAPAGDPTPWVEFDRSGYVVRRFGCARGLVSRFHDVRLEPDGSTWLLCDEVRTLDLSGIGGVAAARVTGSVLQHVGTGGELRFEWNAFDHLDIADLDAASRSGSEVNFTHANAFDFDAQGNILISFRSLSQVVSIDRASGAVRWRLGGTRTDFGPGTGNLFRQQHGLRLTGPGTLQLLDNLGEPGGSRAERYAYDEQARTVTLLGSFESNPLVTAMLGGATQLTRDGALLVAFGSGNRVQEFAADGRLLWEIHGDAGYVYRAQWIGSLYAPALGGMP